MPIGVLNFPSPENTGVPFDIDLPPLAAGRTTRNGQVISGARLTVEAVVEHADVEYVDCELPYGAKIEGLQPVFTRCTVGDKRFLDPVPQPTPWANPSVPARNFAYGLGRDYGLGYWGFWSKHCRFVGIGDALKCNGDTIVEDALIHHLYQFKTGSNSWNHCDGAQVTQGFDVRFSRVNVDPFAYSSGGGVGGTSCFMIKADQGDIGRITIEDSLLGGGYGFAIYCVDGLGGTVREVDLRRLHFRRTLGERALDQPFAKGGQSGLLQFGRYVEPTLRVSDWSWDDTHEPIPWGATGLFTRV